MSHKKIKTISDPKLKLEILSKQDVQKIHEATLHIIENVGVRFPSKRALKIWEDVGADVNHEKKIVKVKPYLIEDALKQAPPAYILGARDPQQNLSLDGNHALACHLIEIAHAAAPADAALRSRRAEIYRRRAEQESSLMARGIFRAIASDES